MWDSGIVATNNDLDVNVAFDSGWYFYGAVCSSVNVSFMFVFNDRIPDLGHVYPFTSGAGAFSLVAWRFDHAPANALPVTFPTAAVAINKNQNQAFPSAYATWAALS